MAGIASTQERLDDQVDPFLGTPKELEPQLTFRFRHALAVVVCVSLLASAAGFFVRESAPSSTGSAGDITELAAASKEKLGTSLFCIMAVLPDSYEVLLLDEMRNRGMSIFACDAQRQFWSKDTGTFVANGYDGFYAEYAANSALFLKFWKTIFAEGMYLHHDWTIKVDPDTVWSPDRLRKHLEALNVPEGDAVYVQNTGAAIEIQGAIEVLSVYAVFSLAKNICVPVQVNGTWGGEDDWLHKCMAQLGIKPKADFRMLFNSWPVAPLDRCDDTSYVAFHPFKNISAWSECADYLESV